MKSALSFVSFCLLSSFMTLQAQAVQDFTITDYNNIEHTLYEDFLDQGKTVAIKLFFTSCPPCIAQAPFYESIYQDWGAGNYDVEFLELSTKVFDSNEDVKNFSIFYGTTMIGSGEDGGAVDAVQQFVNGTYGQYFGTPTYLVIAPNGTVTWNTGISGLDDAITATGAVGPPPALDPATYTLNVTNWKGQVVSYSDAQVFLESNSDPNYSLDISPFLIGGTFSYPTVDIPEVDSPKIRFEDDATDNSSSSGLDLVLIQKHILDIQIFNNPYQLYAADVNNSQSISALDLITLQKYLLNIISELPNGNLVNFFFPSCQSCTEYDLPFQPYASYTIDVVKVSKGDVN